jgi:hypothetical protein
MEKVDHAHEVTASNIGVSTVTKLEEATVLASQYLALDLKSQAEKVQDVWSVVEQASSALTNPETFSETDASAAIRSTAQLLQSADQLSKRANNYLERLRTVQVTLMTKLREDKKGGEADYEKESDCSGGSDGSDDSNESKEGDVRRENGGG